MTTPSPDSKIFSSKKGDVSGTTIGSGSLEDLMRQGLSNASTLANSGRNNFFANDPYSAYRVYLGANYGRMTSIGPSGSSFAPGVAPPGQPSSQGFASYQDAVLMPTQWSPNQLREFVNKGIVNKVPGFEVGMGMPQIQAAWQNMVQSSVLFNMNLKPGQTPWSPMDVLDTWSNQKGKYGTQQKGDWVYDVATGERIKYVGPTSRTTTSKDLDLSSPEEVQALVTQVLREALGRAPSAKELAKFKATITGYEKANPTITTTTQQLSPNLDTGEVNVTSQSSTTTGGVSDAARAQLVNEPTMQTDEYAKYQGGTTYMNALLQMVGGG